ncbi:MAG: YfiR family protein [Gammaproteobacteria bacterium]
MTATILGPVPERNPIAAHRILVACCQPHGIRCEAGVPVQLHQIHQLARQQVRSAGRPLNICVVGKLPETETTNSLTQRKTRNHPIALLHLEQPTDAPCHILFLTRSASQRQLMAALQNTGPATLLVGETRDFARDTGIIGFVTDERHRIRIEVNLEKARQQDLNIRAQLLEIARKVYRDEEPS